MRNRRFGSWTLTLFAFLLGLAIVSPALGAQIIYTPQWGNGGTLDNAWHCGHGWIMANAVKMAANHGAKWVNADLAVSRSTWPDLVFEDHIDHNYNRWGNYPSPYNKSWGTRFGNPQIKVQQYYNAAVAALGRGDTSTASEDIGLMSHYFADIHQPMHTEESALEGNENHFAYERAVDARLEDWTDHQDWIHDDGYQYIPNASAFTVSEAIDSHTHYWTLVDNWVYDGWNSTVANITATQLNRSVNGLSDLIVSAQYDADSVSAAINSVAPSSSTTGQPVAFVGHGADARYAITAYQWRSSIDGVLSTAPSFSTAGLSPGIHTIYFRVKSALGKWSPEVSTPFVVGNAGTVPEPVYRFINRKTNVHFYTASEAEKNNILAHLSGTYSLEGVAFALDESAPANDSPLYRFFNFKQGTHFYTADEGEKNNIIATLGNVYRYDGPAFNVSLTPSAGAQPVYRFYNIRKNVHFYTASLAERDSIVAHLGYIYRYEGEAFYYVSPW